jgi:hypothetical protein
VLFANNDPDARFELVLLGHGQPFVVADVVFQNRIPSRRPRLSKNALSSSVSEPVEHRIPIAMSRDTQRLGDQCR